jgi:hypothetical protein
MRARGGPARGRAFRQQHPAQWLGFAGETVTVAVKTANGVIRVEVASRGTVRLASADPGAAPLIDLGFLAEAADL